MSRVKNGSALRIKGIIGRNSVWTGLYYDQTVDEWMVSTITPVDVEGRHFISLGHDIL